MKRRTVDNLVLWFFGVMTWIILIPLVINTFLAPSLPVFIHGAIWVVFWGGFYSIFKNSRSKVE